MFKRRKAIEHKQPEFRPIKLKQGLNNLFALGRVAGKQVDFNKTNTKQRRLGSCKDALFLAVFYTPSYNAPSYYTPT